MEREVSLKRAEKKDIPVLTAFLVDLFKLEQDFIPNSDRQASALTTILDNPEHAMVYIVQVDGHIAGMVALHLSISTAEGGWAGRIEDLYIKPEFRRQGIGRQVIEEIATIAKKHGLKRLTLIADKDNPPALDFYRACGFTEMNLVSFIRQI